MKKVTAYANANIAVVKYWGKSDGLLNIPAVSSLSMTLDGIGTTVSISPSPEKNHILLTSGQPAAKKAKDRLDSFLEQVRRHYAFEKWILVKTKSNVPYGAGLASSAAFFAALSVALDAYFERGLSLRELSKIARLGSGSAARSILPGFVALPGGEIDHDRAHAFCVPLNPKLQLSMIIAVLESKEKAISSRQAMNSTKASSPFFEAFVNSSENDFQGALSALNDGMFADLGAIMEHSTLKMHATMWGAKPGINYLSPQTLACMNFVQKLRADYGPIAYFTMDAGPNVKILCETQHSDLIAKALFELKLCEDIRVSKPGQGAYLLDEHLT